jgi:hypothetical protein
MSHKRQPEFTTRTAIRESVFGQSTSEELVIVDASVGDLLLPPGTSTEGPFCEKRTVLTQGMLYWAAFVRVARKHYEGRSMFRHLEEVIVRVKKIGMWLSRTRARGHHWRSATGTTKHRGMRTAHQYSALVQPVPSLMILGRELEVSLRLQGDHFEEGLLRRLGRPSSS